MGDITLAPPPKPYPLPGRPRTPAGSPAPTSKTMILRAARQVPLWQKPWESPYKFVQLFRSLYDQTFDQEVIYRKGSSISTPICEPSLDPVGRNFLADLLLLQKLAFPKTFGEAASRERQSVHLPGKQAFAVASRRGRRQDHARRGTKTASTALTLIFRKTSVLIQSKRTVTPALA